MDYVAYSNIGGNITPVKVTPIDYVINNSEISIKALGEIGASQDVGLLLIVFGLIFLAGIILVFSRIFKKKTHDL